MPRWGWWKGLLTGAVIEVPVLAVGVWVLARFGVGDRTVPFMQVFRLTAIFAGIAAVFTAAGLGRLAAHASVVGGRVRAMWVAGRAHAAASIALVLIAAIPHGSLPARGPLWLAYILVGAACGALCGCVIGVVCGGAAPVNIADVWSLARVPGGAIKSILAPSDLLRLGVALRERTSHLLEGIFDPGDKPPGAEPPGAAAAPSSSTVAPPTEPAPPPPLTPARRRGAKPTPIRVPTSPPASDARPSQPTIDPAPASSDPRPSDAQPSKPTGDTSASPSDVQPSEARPSEAQPSESRTSEPTVDASGASSEPRPSEARPSEPGVDAPGASSDARTSEARPSEADVAASGAASEARPSDAAGAKSESSTASDALTEETTKSEPG